MLNSTGRRVVWLYDTTACHTRRGSYKAEKAEKWRQINIFSRQMSHFTAWTHESLCCQSLNVKLHDDRLILHKHNSMFKTLISFTATSVTYLCARSVVEVHGDKSSFGCSSGENSCMWTHLEAVSLTASSHHHFLTLSAPPK